MTAVFRPFRPHRRGAAAGWGVVAIAAGLSVLGVGCDRDVAAPATSSPTGVAAMQFNVDPALLGPGVSYDLPDGRRVEVRPPAGWKALGGDAVALLDRLAKATPTTQPANDESAPQVLGTFTAADGSMLAVSLVPALDPPSRRAALEAEAGIVRADAFPVGGLTVDQYLFESKGRRALRIVVRPVEPGFAAGADRQLQLDYLIDPATLQANALRLESSLGALRLAPAQSAPAGVVPAEVAPAQ